MLGHFVLGAQAFEFGLRLSLNLSVVAVAVDADQFIGILAAIEQFPFIVLIKINELVAARIKRSVPFWDSAKRLMKGRYLFGREFPLLGCNLSSNRAFG